MTKNRDLTMIRVTFRFSKRRWFGSKRPLRPLYRRMLSSRSQTSFLVSESQQNVTLQVDEKWKK